MKTGLAILFLVLAGATPALAECGASGEDACFTNCRTTKIAPFSITKAQDSACYEWDENASLTDDDSGPIMVLTESALFDFDPDRTGTGSSMATIHVRRCTGGWPGSCDPNRCVPMSTTGTTALDGTEGAAGTQNRAVRVGPGLYCVDLVALPGAGDDPVLEIRGETN